MVWNCFAGSGKAYHGSTESDPSVGAGLLNRQNRAEKPPPQPAATHATCPFCDIPPSSVPSSFRIVLESDELVCFEDRSPNAKHHLLTVPRKHIGNIRDLRGKEGAELVDRMMAFGARALDIAANNLEGHLSNVVTSERTLVDVSTSEKRRYGFHISPFNSIDHLHLHCLQEPLTFKGRLKYPVSGPYPNSRPPLIKGFSWFVTADQAIALLKANRRVRIGAQSGFSTVGGQGAREVGGVPGREYRREDHPTGTLSS